MGRSSIGSQQSGNHNAKNIASLEPRALEEREYLRTQTVAMIRDNELAMKDVRTLRKQSKKLQLDTKYKGIDRDNAMADAT